MKPLCVIIAALSLLSACSRLPELVMDPSLAANPACHTAFAQGAWQYQHAIAATVRGRAMGKLIGAMVLSEKERTIQCALMTIEGLVLFSARYDGQLTVERAVKPFDKPGFAVGLMDDLMLMFLAPQGQGRAGRTADGHAMCRYGDPDKGITDIIVRDPDQWKIRRYDSRGRLLRAVSAEREINAHIAERHGIAQHIALESRSGNHYRLELTLIEAVPLEP